MVCGSALSVRWYLVVLFVGAMAFTRTSTAAQQTAPSPTPTPTMLVYCTPPPCQAGEVFYCPGECPGGCGTQCATPTPTFCPTGTPCPTGSTQACGSDHPPFPPDNVCGCTCAEVTASPTPSDTPTPCPTGTPPLCHAGEFVSCDPNPCNGCQCEPCTPCPLGEVFIRCPARVCPCSCVLPQGSIAAGFGVGLPNGVVEVPITLLLEPGVRLGTLDLTLAVSGDGFEPLTSPIAFQPAAVLPIPNVTNQIGTASVRLGWLTGFTPPLSGIVDLGILYVPLPAASGFGSYGLYALDVLDVTATDADGNLLPLRGLGSTITRCSTIFFGLVTDAATGAALPDASVCLNASPCVQTDGNGVYQGLCYPGESSAGARPCAMAEGYEEACQGPWTPGSSRQVDFALAAVIPPSAPEITVSPSTVSLGCEGSFAITINNTGAPGTTLEISALTLAHGYSQGYYGTGFSWDLSHITLPTSLARDEALEIPVTFSAAGQAFPSRLELAIDSNAGNTPHVFMVYFGASQDTCAPTPTPTVTPICLGDCNGDGTVTVNEIILLVNIVLGSLDSSACPSGIPPVPVHVDIVLITDAVNNTLNGCLIRPSE